MLKKYEVQKIIDIMEEEIVDFLVDENKIDSLEDVDRVADNYADDYEFNLGYDLGKIRVLQEIRNKLGL